MKTKQRVLKYIRENGPCSGQEIADAFGVTRQAVHKHVKSLRKNNKVMKIGKSKAASYKIRNGENPIKKITRTVQLNTIEEDRIFMEFSLKLELKKRLSPKSYSIFQYAFTEILNNAIDHSKAEKGFIEVELGAYNISFRIRDYGIGIFHSIYKALNLNDEYEALIELVKGKVTSMSEYHSGEGIFFTSKLADNIKLRSHKLVLYIDNKKGDIYFEEKKKILGTLVEFSISKQTKKKMEAIFAKFAPEEFNFSFAKTYVYVKMLRESFISREKAKRLLDRLDKFSEIILDFKDVKKIGQGFADEIFRVFTNRNPHIKIITKNVNNIVDKMIKHVVDK